MAKKRKLLPGRPKLEEPKDYRVMIRLTHAEGIALEKHAHNSGVGAIATAARASVVKDLIAAGLIKRENGK